MDKAKLIKVVVRCVVAVVTIVTAEYALPAEWAPVHQVLLLVGELAK